MRFNFHDYKAYLECPSKYKRNADGERAERNAYFSVAGELVQKFFEMYANHWRAAGLLMSEAKVRERMRPHWDVLLYYNKVDWKDPMSKLSKEDLYNECISTIMLNLENKDVYEDTKSEVKIEVQFATGDTLVCKIDFVKTLEDASVAIIDGKNSGTIGKYVDERQLLFYAIMYRFKYKVLPKELGFLYYKHLVLDQITFKEEDVDRLWVDVMRVILEIKKAKEFPCKPSAKACKYCDYLSTCETGKKDMDSRKRPKVLMSRASLGLESAFED